jgi:hypothetical protein
VGELTGHDVLKNPNDTNFTERLMYTYNRGPRLQTYHPLLVPVLAAVGFRQITTGKINTRK